MPEKLDALTRPIIGIENRTAQEVFDIMADRIRRALRPGSTGETDGWVLVPRVPSEQMVEAGFDALEACLPTYRETGRDCHPYDLDCRDWDTCSRKEDIGLIVYRAMLAAAGGRDE